MDTRGFVKLARTFTLPPRLTTSRPRDVRLTGAGRALLAVALLLFAGAIASYVLLSREVARQTSERRLLATEGVPTQGVVARLWTDGDDRRRVEYRFQVDTESYVGRATVSDAVRRTLRVGVPITVRFVPTNPRLNDLGSHRSGLPTPLPPIVALLMTLGGGLCLGGIEWQRRLLMDGRAAPAVVTGQRKKKGGKGGSDTTVIDFEFRLLSGAIRRGSATTSKPAADGKAIWIVYDPERPERHMIYPFSLVTPAT
jgi:hypothetical protein